MNFSNKIIDWYQSNKRDLPWRDTKNPYLIWLSEIILQQTRVDQGLSYFLKFKNTYPTVKELANANEDEVLKLWQGLGYYSRARNLHATAKIIDNNYNGIFPNNYDEILQLKGVGEYTAAAIASFSFDLPHAVIDGNVYRVLSRVFGVEMAIDSTEGKKTFKKLANELIDQKNPAEYNQSIMEFGALQCKPKNPVCENCTFLLDCYAYKENIIDQLPFKAKKIKQRNRYFNYFLIHHNKKVYLNKRNKKDIWEGLFDLPLIETKTQQEDLGHLISGSGNVLFNDENIKLIKRSQPYKHILSHQKIHATFWEISIDGIFNQSANFTATSLNNMNNFAIPKLIENYIQTIL